MCGDDARLQVGAEACGCVYGALGSPALPVTDPSVHSPGGNLTPRRRRQTASDQPVPVALKTTCDFEDKDP